MRTILGCVMAVALLASVGTAGEGEAPGASAEQIARLILGPDGPQQNFASQYLEHADQETLRAVQSALRALAPEAAKRAHAEKARAKAVPELKTGPVDLVTVTTRILEIDAKDAFLRDVGIGLHGLGEAPSLQTTFIDDTQVEVLLRAVEKSKRIKQLTAPRLSVYNGQRANISMLETHDYVKRLELTCVDGATVLKPVRSSVVEGLVLQMVPTLSRDKRYITLELEGTAAGIAKPMREETVEFQGVKYTKTVPQVSLHSWRSTVRIPSGGSILIQEIGSTTFGAKGSAQMLLVTATTETITVEALEDGINLKPAKAKRRKAPAKK